MCLEYFRGKKCTLLLERKVRGIRDKTRKGKLSLGQKGFLCRPNHKDSIYDGTGTSGGWQEELCGTITGSFGGKIQNWLKG